MRSYWLTGLLLLAGFSAEAQKKKRLIYGMYAQWGYNTEWYTRSNIHIKMSNGSDFTLHKARAMDKPDMDAILKKPGDISIPQYNYRLGFYINPQRTKSIELNFDHAKYVVYDGQTIHVTGTIEGKPVNGDSIMNPYSFMHLEHTDGANWLHIMYVQQKNLKKKWKDKDQPLLNFIWKAGAGINIPRTDFTWKGDRMNNDFHVAGYNISVESGLRYYPFGHFFIEGTAKTGYVRYINALANSTALKGNRATHGFGYLELIGLIGFDIKF